MNNVCPCKTYFSQYNMGYIMVFIALTFGITLSWASEHMWLWCRCFHVVFELLFVRNEIPRYIFGPNFFILWNFYADRKVIEGHIDLVLSIIIFVPTLSWESFEAGSRNSVKSTLSTSICRCAEYLWECCT